MSRILLVDDEAVAREVIGAQLEKLGHTVFTAASAEEAMAVFSGNSMDMALVDLRLGEGSGLDLLPVFREQNPECQIALITAYASVATAAEAMRLGASDYLVKPVQTHDLVRAVERCLEHRRMLKENRRLEEENRQHRQHLEERVREQTAETAESEQRFRAIFETIRDLYYRTDMEGRVTNISPSCLPLTGYSPEELIGTDITTYYADADQRDALLQALQKNGSANDFEVELVHKDGTRRIASLTSHIVFDQQHHPVAVEGIARDITERKQAEQNLHEANARITSLVDNLPGGVLFEDQHGRMSYLNQSFCDMFSIPVPPEAIMGTDCAQAAEEAKHLFADPEGFLASIETAEDEQQLIIGQEMAMADGRTLIYDYVPILVNKRLHGHLWHYRDISSRKQTEEALQASEARYRVLVESMPDAIVVHCDGKIVFVNKSAGEMLASGNPDDLIGKQALQFIHPECREMVKKRVQRALEQGEPQPLIEEKMMRLDGSEFVAQVVGTPVQYGNKRAIQVVLCDITDRKKAEEALAEKTMYLDNILRSSTEYAIATTDLDFRITYYNPMAEKLFGYTAEEVIGKTVREIHTKEKVEPERFDQAIKNVRKFGAHQYIVEKETRAGRQYISSRVSGIFDSGREMVGYALFSRDVTEFIQKEEAITRLNEENRRLAQQLILAQDAERRSIARELHDELGQSLTMIKTEIARAASRSRNRPELAEIIATIDTVTDEVIASTRHMFDRLRPAIMDGTGLAEEIGAKVKAWEKRYGVACSLAISGEVDDLNEQISLTVYRIVQECLTNVAKHACASKVQIQIYRRRQSDADGRERDTVLLVVADDGKGMALDKFDSKGLGLIGMRERAHTFGGSMDIESAPDRGTRVAVTIPLER